MTQGNKGLQYIRAAMLGSATLFCGGMVHAAGLEEIALTQASDEALQPSADAESRNIENESIIVVTGSRLGRNTGLDAPSPVTTIDESAIASRGTTNLGNVVAELPAISSRYSSGGGLNNGAAGLNLLDLRGMGPERTLVLINGRRQVASVGSFNSVDINTIPIDMIDRVEVVTGGASAVYGADAVTGVVNFILKDHIDGVTARAQAGVSSRGAAGSTLLSVTGGTSFGGDRGSIILNAEYSDSERLVAKNAGLRFRNGLYANNPVNTGAGDGIPDRIFIPDVSVNIFTPGGSITSGSPGHAPLFKINGDGTLRPFNLGSPTYLGGTWGVGGEGLRFDDVTDLQPNLQRLAFNGRLSYAINNSATLYAEAKYVDVRSKTRSGWFLSGDEFNFISISPDNPFLSEQAREVLSDGNVTGPLFLQRFSTDFGPYGRDYNRSLKRGVAGLNGALFGDWKYDLSYVYGEAETHQKVIGDVLRARYRNAIDVVSDETGALGVIGAPVCRSRLSNPNSSDPDIAQCVPLNLFGFGAPSKEALSFIRVETTIREKLKQHVATAAVTGSVIELPAGEARGALGVEYRSESLKSVPDALLLSRSTTVSGTSLVRGSFDVKEVFAEVSIPLLKDNLLAHKLSVDGAIRFADYSLSGENKSWKLGVEWAPFEALRFRSTLSRAVRAPNLVELFQPQTVGTTFISDPCELVNIDNSPNRRANCAAIGVPVGFSDPPNTRVVSVVSGGNPDLSPERSKSWTAGVVFQPLWLPGFGAAVDYWSISINDIISFTQMGSTLSGCVDAAKPNSDFCDLIERDSNGFITSVRTTRANLASRKAAGLDFDVNYRFDVGSFAAVDLRLVGTWLDRFVDLNVQNDPASRNPQLGEIGYPEWKVNFVANLSVKDFSVHYTMRFIDSFTNGDQVVLRNNPEAVFPIKYGSRTYHEIQLEKKISRNFSFYGGVNNIFDNSPPYGANITSSNFGFYDVLGRFFYAGIRVSL